MARFSGQTQDAVAPFVPSGFWKKGVKLSGKVIRLFDLGNGPSAALKLSTPLHIEGRNEENVSIGIKTGIRMALQSCGLDSLQAGDRVAIECTGETDTGKDSPRSDFRVDVDRN